MLTFSLHKKRLRIVATESGITRRLYFALAFEGREALTSTKGEQVRSGYAELSEETERLGQSQLHFTRPWRDNETGENNPASVSFYALLPSAVIDRILDLPAFTLVTLNVHMKELMGAIQFGNDPEGFEKLWNIEQENPVFPESFEFSIEYVANVDA